MDASKLQKQNLERTVELLADRVRQKQAQAPKSRKIWWAIDSESGRLGVMARTQIVVAVLQHFKLSNVSKLAETLETNMKGRLPWRRAGGSGEWEWRALQGWLSDESSVPTLDEAVRILNELASVADDLLRGIRPKGAPLAAILSSVHATIEQLLYAILEPIQNAEQATYQLESKLKPLVAGSLRQKPKSLVPPVLREAAKEANAAFLGKERKRVVVIHGATYVGKKTALRVFIHEETDQQFLHVDNNLRLPILALPLDHLSPTECVDLVHQFYSADNEAWVNPASDEGPLFSKLEEIRWMAKRAPACIVVADMTSIDRNEINRTIFEDYVGDALCSIINGHPASRILLTTTEQSRHVPLVTDTGKHLDAKHIDIPEKVPLPDRPLDLFERDDTQAVTMVSGMTANLAEIAFRTIEERVTDTQRRLGAQRYCRVELEKNNWAGLLDVIWKAALSAEDRILVGLIACSHDGLRASVLLRMLRTRRSSKQNFWSAANVSTEELPRRLSRLRHLILDRSELVDQHLDPSAPATREQLYFIDEAWRREIIRCWSESDPEAARFGQWLIAREAAAQSRAIRVLEPGTGPTVSYGRNLQALLALIASVDPAPFREGSPPRHISPRRLETLILPPLERDADQPDPRLTLRYAYLQLYRNDLEGDSLRLLMVLDDARLRLEALLPFFTPHRPWLRATEFELKREWEAYPHLLAALEPTELMDLLTAVAIAALRLRKFALVTAAARLGEELDAQGMNDGSSVAFMRLLRAEIDAGILVGGNPDAILELSTVHFRGVAPPRDAQLSGVADRIENLLSGPFSRQDTVGRKIARGKLLGRLGEIRHFCGQLHLSHAAFREAEKVETEASELLPIGQSVGPVLGGRGARTYLRVLLDRARREAWLHPKSSVAYPDGLVLPLPPRIPSAHPLLGEAIELHNLNIRRLGRERTGDRVGVKIDAARLAAAQYDFANALSALDAARKLRQTAGSSVEVLLELLAVRGRISIDAALVCNVASMQKTPGLEDTAKRLSDYLGGNGELTYADLSQALAARALEGVRALNRYVSASSSITSPYSVYAQYLDAWLSILNSRKATESAKIILELKAARHKLESAVRHMREVAYRMHLAEAQRLERGINASLDFHNSPVRSKADTTANTSARGMRKRAAEPDGVVKQTGTR